MWWILGFGKFQEHLNIHQCVPLFYVRFAYSCLTSTFHIHSFSRIFIKHKKWFSNLCEIAQWIGGTRFFLYIYIYLCVYVCCRRSLHLFHMKMPCENMKKWKAVHWVVIHWVNSWQAVGNELQSWSRIRSIGDWNTNCCSFVTAEWVPNCVSE
jgi:hypothetical protein